MQHWRGRLPTVRILYRDAKVNPPLPSEIVCTPSDRSARRKPICIERTGRNPKQTPRRLRERTKPGGRPLDRVEPRASGSNAFAANRRRTHGESLRPDDSPVNRDGRDHARLQRHPSSTLGGQVLLRL